MNKLQTVQASWIELGFEPSNMDKNGWIDYDFLPDGFDIGNLESENRRSSTTGRLETFVRPKSLKGIQDNNGWIKIESENDLPKNNDSYWIIDKLGNMEKVSYYGKDDLSIRIWLTQFTHYKPVEKPKSLPVY